jgi:hypothetical protein
MPCHIHAGGYVQCINDIILSMGCVLYILLRQQPTNNQAFYPKQVFFEEITVGEAPYPKQVGVC